MPVSEARNSMRAFLQRAEVRLSTMHRVAGAFLGGAGLLVLFPALATQVLPSTAKGLLASSLPVEARIALVLLLLPILGLPLYSLFLLLRDLTHFYFTPHHPGQSHDFFLPKFSLAALSFPLDEPDKDIQSDHTIDALGLKAAIVQREENPQFLSFLLPYREDEKENLGNLLRRLKRGLIPDTRLGRLGPDPDYENPSPLMYLYGAFAIAGYADRSLIEEVARMELSLARHALNLRRVVLRYVKSFLLFISTTLVLVGSAFVLETSDPLKIKLHLAILIAWALLAPKLIALPISWIYVQESANRGRDLPRYDNHLIAFENIVHFVCHLQGLLAISFYLLYLAQSVAERALTVPILIAHFVYSLWTYHALQKRRQW